MERFFKAFKDLYTGELVKKKHIYFLLMLIYPALFASVLNSVDKTTPKEILFNVSIMAIIFFVGSLVCWIYLSGFSLQFIKDRFDGVLGFPLLENSMFKKGLKVLPLDIAWILYNCIFIGALFAVPIVLMLRLLNDTSSKGIVLLGILAVFCIILALLIVFMFLVLPFMFYLRIEYVKHGELFAGLFNPLILIRYMKKAFIDTVLLTLKFFLVNFLASLCMNVLMLLSGVFIILISAVVLTVFHMDSLVDNPWFMLTTTVLIVSVFQLIYTYVISMINYAAIDNLVEIYDNKIAEKE